LPNIFLMKRHITLTEAQNETLQILLQSEQRVKIHRRLMFIDLKNQKKKNTEIMKVIPVTINTLSDWTSDFLTHGFDGLQKLHYAGRRPGKLAPLKDIIKQHTKEHVVKNTKHLQSWLRETL
jgi:transposase